ncbi:hypothetical protein G4B88_012196 [Cannabis sativa]|uniref:Uncharacterized protein n=1 Tax=Cannabis sativa TaxID=3483 RepID=A0A7J6I5R2_CANSA|nr:hypothetical protein G4B88_012196 [Cannabis sativa]
MEGKRNLIIRSGSVFAYFLANYYHEIGRITHPTPVKPQDNKENFIPPMTLDLSYRKEDPRNRPSLILLMKELGQALEHRHFPLNS